MSLIYIFFSIGHTLADTITCSVDPMSYVDNIMNTYGYKEYNIITEN